MWLTVSLYSTHKFDLMNSVINMHKETSTHATDAENGEGKQLDEVPAGVVVDGEHEEVVLAVGIEEPGDVGSRERAKERPEECLHGEVGAGHLQREEHTANRRSEAGANTARHCR